MVILICGKSWKICLVVCEHCSGGMYISAQNIYMYLDGLGLGAWEGVQHSSGSGVEHSSGELYVSLFERRSLEALC